MKVKELKQLLEGVDDERIVVLSRDPEGNGFSPLVSVEIDMKYDQRGENEIGYEKLTPELIKAGYTEEDVIEGGKLAIVLWPTR